MASITRLVTPRAAMLLGECRTLLLDGMPAVLKEFGDRVDDAFFELAHKADSSMRQQRYFDAMRDWRLKRPRLEREFLASLDAVWRREVEVPARAAAAPEAASGVELSLLEADQIEEELAVNQLVSTLEHQLRAELYGLDQRFGHLLSDPQLELHRNPLGPPAFGDALRAMTGLLSADVEARVTIYKLYERHAPPGIQTLYRRLNDHLCRAGILPRLHGGLQRTGVTRTRVTIETEHAAGGPQADDIFSTLQRLLRGGRNAQVPATTATAGPSTPVAARYGSAAAGSVPDTDPVAELPTATFIANLTLLQNGHAGNEAFPAAGGAWSRNGDANGIRVLREQGVASPLSEADTLTLEIVALLFDCILEDTAIADPIKSLIGRLQIPYLKVALLDKELFSKKTHPARRLLDAMAEAAVGLSATSPEHDALFGVIRNIVARIVDEFDSDLGLFAELLAGFQAYLADDKVETRRHAELSTQSLRTREKVVLAKMEVDDAVKRRLELADGRDFVQQFVLDYWRQLLIVTHVESGTQSDAWHAQLQVVDDLLWSIEAKSTPDERKSLTNLLPKLLKQLRAGMHELQMPPDAASKFLSMLASVHVVSVKRMEEATLAERLLMRRDATHAEVTPPARPEEEIVRQALQRLVERNAIDGHALDFDLSAFESAAPCSAQEAEVPDAAECAIINQVLALDLGDWLDLMSSDGTVVRARFTYISPVTGRYLFTDRQGHKAFDLSFDELTAFFRRNAASRVRTQSDPLFDRALGALMDRLTHSAVA